MIRVFNLEFFFVGNDFQCSRKINLVNIRYGYVNMDTQRSQHAIVLSIFLLEEFRREKNICREYTRIYETQWFH